MHALAGVGGDAGTGGAAAMTSGSGRVTGLVLAAGGSKRLGRPKQLLRFGSGTLLGHVLDTARGQPASGVPVVLSVRADSGEWREITRGSTDRDGRARLAS